MRSAGRLTRLVLVASLALTAAFSALAEFAFPGRSNATAGREATAAPAASSSTVRVALPPKGGEGLAPPPAFPVQPAQPVAPVATSGGS